MTSARISDPEEFCQAEFWDAAEDRPDQRLSVYRAPPNESVRVHAEHCAAAGMTPPKDGAVLDVSDGRECAELIEAPRAEGYFAMTDAAHAELCFAEAADVRDYAEKVRQSLGERRIDVARHALRDHARSRLAANDTEWVRFVETAPKGASWR